MTTSRTLLFLTLSALLAACGHSVLPVHAPGPGAQTGQLLTTLEECHGCGVLPDHSGRVERFWTGSVPFGDPTELPDGSEFHVIFQRSGIGMVINEMSGLIDLQAQGYGSELAQDFLPLACVAPETLPQPAVLQPQDGGWSGHRLAFTPPLGRDVLSSVTAADEHCAATFGPGWSALPDLGDLPSWSAGAAVWDDGSNTVTQ